MFEIILFFLFAALLLYVILAGADFGAGMLELFSSARKRSRQAEVTYHAIGPVWEANHIWIILVIVILFNGFPEAYALISNYLHIPLLLMLVGIIFRGAAFAFRHYDAVKDGSQRYYTALFAYSSLLTPLFLGTLAGATMLGAINPQAPGFYEAYLAPWLNPFSVSVGLLFSVMCLFTASVFLLGEAEGEADQQRFKRFAQWANAGLIPAGLLVFLLAHLSGIDLLKQYLDAPAAWGSMLLASLSIPPLWLVIGQRKYLLARLLAGFQVSMIVFGWMAMQYPVMIHLAGGEALTLQQALAPPSVQYVLVVSLLLGSLLIFPGLYWLFRVFKLSNLP